MVFLQVKRIAYLITDSIEEDGFIPWSLERSCTDVCQPFCVTMGARTKVTYCTSCCSEDRCNTCLLYTSDAADE